VANPESPFVAILGGAKVGDKIPVIENLLNKVDRLLIGGGMMFTFLKAQGKEIGKSLLDGESLDVVHRLINEHSDRIVLPVDCVVSDALDFKGRQLGKTEVVSVDEIPPGWVGLDIGPRTIELFSQALRDAKTIVWNGPMGIFEIEDSAVGTTSMANLLAELTGRGAITIIGGGDSASAVKKAGVAAQMSHVSTGGGASLEFLQGKELPGISVLTDA
jgi:3-phosphoglycerate kinase